jgi:hypothetical protein
MTSFGGLCPGCRAPLVLVRGGQPPGVIVSPTEVHDLVRGSALKQTQRLVLIEVAVFANGDEGECYASQELLAENTGLATRTIRRDLKALVKLGVLAVVDGSLFRSTTYAVRPAAIPARPAAGTPFRVAPRATTPVPRAENPAPHTGQPAPRATHPALRAIEGTTRKSSTDETIAAAAATRACETTEEPEVLLIPQGRQHLEAIDAVEAAVAELVFIQERDAAHHGLASHGDRQAIRAVLGRGYTQQQLLLLWEWARHSDDDEADACRNKTWDRWKSLLKWPNGKRRMESAIAWDVAGRPGPGLCHPRAAQRNTPHTPQMLNLIHEELDFARAGAAK